MKKNRGGNRRKRSYSELLGKAAWGDGQNTAECLLHA